MDYGAILEQAEQEADVILWDGGNNDIPFYRSDLEIVVVDPHRPGHELLYYPGETNFRRADVLVINKMDTAPAEGVEQVKANIQQFNPDARVVEANSAIHVPEGDEITGKTVLVVEDGPTLTHGEMKFGAGIVAAEKYGAAHIVDPRPYAVGSIKATFEKYNHLDRVLPAMGYGHEQMVELAETYSHGMKQRVVLSAALLHEPRVIVIDEPMVGLDPKGANTLKNVLRELTEKGGTVFMSTHTLAVAEQTADRVGIIRDGSIVALGSLDEIYSAAQTDGRLEEAFLRLTQGGE